MASFEAGATTTGRSFGGAAQSSLLPEESPDAVELAAEAAWHGSDGAFDELHGGPVNWREPRDRRSLASPWRRFFEAGGPAAWRDLAARLAQVQRRVREDGATYNVFADDGPASHAWPLELLPFVVDAGDWETIERGVLQRTRMLDAVMADVYGERTLLRDGLLPAALVQAHPQYLRPAVGLEPRGGVRLHIAAFDLARAADGRWRVLAQRLQAPSGLGYLLENRIIVGRQFPEAFAALRIQHLGAAFKAMLAGLTAAAGEGANTRIALLTPGPHSETYFEHVFLARYLGVPLVEGGDLAVRRQRLYLKAMHGLEPVHVLLRRVDDEWLDPLELRPDSALGVPGLLQAVRAGHCVLANAPGAGVLESPGLAAFWPAIAERLTGEPLHLPSSTSWWCGEAAVWRRQRRRLDEFVVAPTFPTPRAFEPVVVANHSAAGRARLESLIDAEPAQFTLQSRVRLSETPVWAGGALEPRAAVLRVYAFADGRGGWQAMPGGLTRVASRRFLSRDPWLSMQHGSASADTWVIVRGAVDAFDAVSLLPKPLSADELSHRRAAVTSRAAENLFWMGRYAERAENTVRLVQTVLEHLSSASGPVLELLRQLSVRQGLVEDDVPLSPRSTRAFEQALVAALPDMEEASSVGYNLRALRQSAEARRDRLSTEHWHMIREAEERFLAHFDDAEQPGLPTMQGEASPRSDLSALLARTATQLAAITGAQIDRMTRDDGWRLLSIGRLVERMDLLADALATAFELNVPETDEGFALLLGLFDSVISYRSQFQSRREVLPLLCLLALDIDNPRSLAWISRTLRGRVDALGRHEPAWTACAVAALPDTRPWSLAALGRRDADGRYRYFVSELRRCRSGVRSLSDEISRRFFSHVQGAHRAVWQ